MSLTHHIRYPWKFEINPHFQQLVEHHHNWLFSTGFASTELAYRRIKDAQIVEFTAWCWPNGSYEDLTLIIDWLTCHFALDDWLDGDMGHFPQTELANYILNHLAPNLDNPTWKPGTLLMGIETTIFESWQRMKKLPPPVFVAFAQEWKNWTEGCRWEVRIRQDGFIPSQEEYLRFRKWSSGSHICFLLSDYTYGLVDESGLVWQTLSQHPVIQRLEQLVDMMLTVVNDSFSSAKEHSNVNLVRILEHQGKSGQALQDRLMVQHDQALVEFLELESNLSEIFTAEAELNWARLKVKSWRQLLRASFEWTRQNRRYAVGMAASTSTSKGFEAVA